MANRRLEDGRIVVSVWMTASNEQFSKMEDSYEEYLNDDAFWRDDTAGRQMARLMWDRADFVPIEDRGYVSWAKELAFERVPCVGEEIQFDWCTVVVTRVTHNVGDPNGEEVFVSAKFLFVTEDDA